jgi:hypothetical protein
MRMLQDMLAENSALTRAEIVERLAAQGIRLEGQAVPHLLGRAALDGLICYGPDRAAEPTYVLLDDWIGQGKRGAPLQESAAYAELTHRYLAAYGPATPKIRLSGQGCRARYGWPGVSDRPARRVMVSGAPAWTLKSQAGWLNSPLHLGRSCA